MQLLIVILASLSFTIGGVFMKYANYSAGNVNLYPTLASYVFFLLGVTFQTIIMQEAELGVVYVLVLGLEALFAVLFGYLFFKESLSLIKIFSILLIVIGIALLHVNFNNLWC